MTDKQAASDRPQIDIVYVEDDPRLRMMYRINLEADGFDVREASNGLEGLELVRQQRPDVVLADIFMPEMDGIQMVEMVRAEMDSPPIIVFLSANPMSFDEDMLRLLGDDYLRKPFPPASLGVRLRELLAERGSQ